MSQPAKAFGRTIFDMINPEVATAKLASRFTHLPGIIVEQSHARPDRPVSYQEIMVEITHVVATNFTSPVGSAALLTPGQEFQQLVTWNRWLRAACSERYADLQDPSKFDSEGLGREALNRDPDLVMLNGIRRGVHRAMKTSQRYAERYNAAPRRAA